MRPLRIGFLAAGWSPEPGGVQSVTRELASELMSRGHSLSALVLDGEPGAGEGEEREQLQAGVCVRRVGWSYSADTSLADLARSPALEAHVLRWVLDRELDLVHLHHLSGWGLGVPPRLAELGVPVLWTLHDYWALCARGQLFHVEGRRCERAEAESCGPCMAQTWPQLASDSPVEEARRRLVAARSALDACRGLQAPSAAAARVLEAHGLAAGAVKVRPNASPSPCTPATRSQADVVRVGVLGAVQPSKGVLELARWIVELEGFELHVHGPRDAYHGDRSYCEALEALAQSDSRVILHGTYEPHELPGLFTELDLVAVPSLWEEVFGLVAREASAAGLPVFASEVGGLSEAAALHLPAGDGRAWLEALLRFSTDQAWRESLTSPPASQHDLRAVVDRLERDYLALLE
jgi:glycosyltransferase involved in cell wall biosynthesis